MGRDADSTRRVATHQLADAVRYWALMSMNLANARSNTPLKSHIAFSVSRSVADVLARSAFPKVKMLLLRKYRIILGSDIL